MESTRNLKIAAAIVGLALIALIMWSILQIRQTDSKVAVAIIKAPADATVVVDGKNQGGDVVYLDPGPHSYIISRAEFKSVAGEIAVRKDIVGQTITGVLTPTSDRGREIYENNRKDFSLAESTAGDAAETRGEAQSNANPIIDLLPYTNFLFTIGYRADPADPTGVAIILEIDASPTYRDAAVTQISAWGYNPAEYKINFKNEENPFK